VDTLIGFDETQQEIVDEHPAFLDDVQEYMHCHYGTDSTMPHMKKMESQRAETPMCNDCYCVNASRTPL
jgi:hypothetical protein